MIFAICIVFLVGMWTGMYIIHVLGPSKKAKKEIIDGLQQILDADWAHCSDKIKAAIKFIEKHT